ncbi:NADH-quinone oxidoreductase subunit B family protein [Hydrogenobaculum acidophilum]
MLNVIKTFLKDGIKTEDINSSDESSIVIYKKLPKMLKGSLSIRHVDCVSCNACEYELTALSNIFYDIERFGIKFVASPKHADVLSITGPITRNMHKPLLDAINNVPNPKIIIAIGDCAMDGGIFRGAYGVIGGLKDIEIEPHILIKGCPPTPKDIIKGILKGF